MQEFNMSPIISRTLRLDAQQPWQQQVGGHQ